MAILTKHIGAALNFLDSAKTIKITDKKAEVFVPKIFLDNSDMLFSASMQIGLSIATINGRPACQSTENSMVVINILATQDTNLRNLLQQNSLNFGIFQQIINQNRNKIQIISMPYENEGDLRGQELRSFMNISLDPIRLFNADNPDNLYFFGFVVNKNTALETEILLSEIIFQDIIVSGEVVYSPNIVDKRLKNLQSYLNFDIINQVNNDKEAYFSDQYISLDPDGHLKFVFMWDKVQFLQEKSLFGNVLKNCSLKKAKQQIIEESRISDIKIIRKRVKKNINGFSNFLKNQKSEVVIYSSDDESGDLLSSQKYNTKTGKIQAKISTVNKIHNSNNYIMFAVDDYSPLKVKQGMYQYSVSIKLEDGMLKHLLQSLSDLRKIKKTLITYQNVFNSASLPIQNKSKDAIAEMLNILFSLGPFSEPKKGKVKLNFESLLEHEDGLSTIISFNEELIEKISYALGERGVSLKNNKDKTSSKNTSKLFSLEDVQSFHEIVDFSHLVGKKEDFLNLQSDSSTGADMYLESLIKERFMKEFKKVINVEDEYENINFSDLNNKILQDNLTSKSQSEITNKLFNFENNFFSYLSPLTIPMNNTQTKNEDFSIQNYSPLTENSLNSVSSMLAEKGIKILTPNEIQKRRQEEVEKGICAENIFGSDDNIINEKTYEQQSDISSDNKKSFYDTQRKSYGFSAGIKKYYNNFNLSKQYYNLNDSNNLINKKTQKENQEMLSEEIDDMPNQIRSLFGSNSDLVVNKWNLMENDFLANPISQEMMRQNYSNLIKIEVLAGFEKDSDNAENIKSPIFKKLQISDIQNLNQGERLLCRTYILDDKSLGIGQKQISEKESIYYNKHFFIEKEGNQ